MPAHRYHSFLLFFTLIFLFSAISLFSAELAFLHNGRIAYGVTCAGIPLNGLSTDEAEKKVAAFGEKKLTNPAALILSYETTEWPVKSQDISLSVNAAESARRAYAVGRDSHFAANALSLLQSFAFGKDIPVAIDFDKQQLHRIYAEAAKTINQPSQDAFCVKNPDHSVQIVPEKEGRALSVDKAVAEGETILLSLDLPKRIFLKPETSQPERTKKDLLSINTVLSTFSTSFDPGDRNRSENLRIGAESLNHLLITPKEKISFNETVGHRVADAGYKEAPVIVDGEVQPGIGGGICQVSSTLYNAILLANLKSTERSVHYYPSSYVSIGFDATVADDLLDLKFENTFSHKIYLLTEVHGGTLTISVLGNSADRLSEELRLVSTVDKTIAPETRWQYTSTLAPGQHQLQSSGRNGYLVSAYRLHIKNGQEISREFLHQDEYEAKDRVILTGTK